MARQRTIKNLIITLVSLVLTAVVVVAIAVASSNNSLKANAKKDYTLAPDVQSGVTLDCWNWSYKTIEEHLEEIVEAGFSTVQVSPVQNTANYSTDNLSWQDNFNKMYEVTSFSIAKNGYLGTKDELKSLCNKAEQYDVKVVCEVVLNNLASDSLDAKKLNAEVEQYEKTIFKNQEEYLKEYLTEGNDINSTVNGNIGSPDLDTSSKYIQGRAVSLLTDCVDAGVDGFAFVDAKNIETDEDGEYSSDFWSSVITQVDNYATQKEKTIYYYGEILDDIGVGRTLTGYTKHMSVTDTQYTDSIRQAIENNDFSLLNSKYIGDTPSNKIVLNSESKETFANDNANVQSILDVNKTWAILASRADATSVYFSRAGHNDMGQMGSTYWKSNEVSIVNQFHNKFIGTNEFCSTNGSLFMNERYEKEGYLNGGAVIVNSAGGNVEVELFINKLGDGEYIDKISGNTFIISNGVIKGMLASSGIAVIYSKIDSKTVPSNYISKEGGNFTTSSISITLGLNNASSGTYRIGENGSIVSYSSRITITIGANMSYGQKVVLYLTASDGKHTTNANYTFRKIDPNDEACVYFDNAQTQWEDVYAYIYTGTNDFDGTYCGIKLEEQDGLYFAELPDGSEGKYVLFNNGKAGSELETVTDEDGEGFLLGKYSWIYQGEVWSEYFGDTIIESTNINVNLADGFIAVYFQNTKLWKDVYCVYKTNTSRVEKIALDMIEVNEYGENIMIAPIPIGSSCYFTDGLSRTIEVSKPQNGLGYYPTEKDGQGFYQLGEFDYIIYPVTISAGYTFYFDLESYLDFDDSKMKLVVSFDDNYSSNVSKIIREMDGKVYYKYVSEGGTFRTITLTVYNNETLTSKSLVSILREGKNLFVVDNDFDDGYWATIDSVDGKLIADAVDTGKNKYDLSNVKFESVTKTYTGEFYSLEVLGLPSTDISVKYYLGGSEFNGISNAGSYSIKAVFTSEDDTYEQIEAMYATLTIKKANYDMSGVSFASKTVTYNSDTQKMKIEGVLPDGVSVNYINNGNKNAGTYSVTANFTSSNENYNIPNSMTATLTIKKASYDMSDISFDSKTVTIGGDRDMKVSGDLPNGVKVEYYFADSGDTFSVPTETGKYYLKAVFSIADTLNYNTIGDLFATLTITNKHVYSMTSVEFNSSSETYDGEVKNLQVSTLPSNISVKYYLDDMEFLGVKDAGVYTIRAVFETTDAEYENPAEMIATLTINKADYDTSGITFDNTTFVYDGGEKSILIAGNKDIIEKFTTTYTYKQNGVEIDKGQVFNAGDYQVEANLVSNDTNYNDVIMSASLTINKADYDMSNISFVSSSYIYSGTKFSIAVSGELPEGVAVSYTNNGQIEIGDYEVEASFVGDAQNYNEIPSMFAILKIMDDGLKTVYFANNQNWSNVYCHYWVSGTGTSTSWPGIKMTYVGNNDNNEAVYSIKIPDDAYVVFNSGSSSAQTVDIKEKNNDGYCYYLVSSAGSGKYNVAYYMYALGGHGTVVTERITIYFTDTLAWNRVWCKYYLDGVENGIDMNYIGENGFNQGQYKVSVPVGVEVFFTNDNNTAKTKSVTAVDGTGYYVKSSSTSSPYTLGTFVY